MDLPSRSEPYKKNEINPPPLVFQFFLATVWTESQTQCALCLGEDEVTIYIKITVATGAGDITMHVAYEDHNRIGLMR
jgi:hypothetical protein